ncbi:family 2 glycosyl transferase [Agromyces sp. Root1464]|nr:family 2 glycosyl transferase [Agromyces sp. Root1464]
MSSARTKLSLVVPAYNEHEAAQEIVDFYRQIRATHPDHEFELIVVDDGSSDGTADAIAAVFDSDDDARVVSLSRNFGSHAAITAGFAHATGDAALTLSADRQEPIESIASFIAEWTAGADIVWGLRSVRATKRGMSESFATGFSKVYQRYSDVPSYPSEGPSQILVARSVLDVLNEMPELNRNVLAMAAWTGFDQRRVYFEQLPRPHGASKWTSKKKMKLVVDSFVEFSHAPLQWLAFAGVTLGALGVLALLGSLVLVFTPASGGAGWLMVAGLVLAVGGFNALATGVLGEYVWRAGDDARHRPAFIVKSVTGPSSGNA